MITLRTLLAVPGVDELKVIAGEDGLDHMIQAVATLDAPDGPRWLRGNEFILTSSYIFKDNLTSVEKFVRDLIEVGAAGLGFKSGRFLESVPPSVLEIANRSAFPILTIPQKLVWSDIIAPFYELQYKISSSANTVKLESHMIDQIFMACKWGPIPMLDRMTELFEIPMAVIGRGKRMIKDNGLPGVGKLTAILQNRKLFLENSGEEILKLEEGDMLIRPVPFSREEVYFVMLTENTNFLHEVSSMFRLLDRLQNADRSVADTAEDRYRRLLMDVVSDRATPEALRQFAAGRDRGERVYERIVLLVTPRWQEVHTELRQQLSHQTKDQAMHAETHLFYDENSSEAVVLIEARGGHEDKMSVAVRAAVRTAGRLLDGEKEGFVASGRQCEGLEHLPDAYRQAREAGRIGAVLWRGRTSYFYSSVALYSMVSRLGFPDLDLGDVRLLEESQKQFSFDGVTTLEAYLEASSYKKAAARLYIHENTMRYRIQKICELLNIDVEDPQLIQSMTTKIKLWRLMRMETPGEAGKRSFLERKDQRTLN